MIPSLPEKASLGLALPDLRYKRGFGSTLTWLWESLMPPQLPLQLKDVPWPRLAEDPWQWLGLYPESLPLILLGSRRSNWSLLGLAWDRADEEEFFRSPPARAALQGPLPMTVGTLGLLSYDGFSPLAHAASSPHIFLRLRRTLLLDQRGKRAYICAESGWENAAVQVPLPWELPSQGRRDAISLPPVSWHSSWSDARYLQEVEAVVEEIKSGRFYQLNLLRYWQCESSMPRSYWGARGSRWAGPFGAYLDLPELQLISFSPERFFSCDDRGDHLAIRTEPIKGTRPVAATPAEDAEAQRELATAPKDRAELNMIVDLMRNDLHRVSHPGSVRVLDPGSVHTFPNVHHLIATIEGRLRADISWKTLLQALCPGGSITGAPKREVMLAIFEHEQRPRSYFMGNLLYADAYTGHADASILIRTALSQRPGSWEFAAGSGLVVHSQAAEELAEVFAKARVVLSDPGNL